VTAEPVGVLGLGLMGRPIARRLAQAGFAVRGWNRSPLADDEVEGIEVVGELDAAARAPVLVLVLSDSAATGAVLERLSRHLRAGALVIDMGSSDPGDSRERALVGQSGRFEQELECRRVPDGLELAPLGGGDGRVDGRGHP